MKIIRSIRLLLVVALTISTMQGRSFAGEGGCHEKQKAVLSWRKECPFGAANAGWMTSSSANRKKWCFCVGDNFDVMNDAPSDCTWAGNTAHYVENYAKLDERKLKCGTPKDPN